MFPFIGSCCDESYFRELENNKKVVILIVFVCLSRDRDKFYGLARNLSALKPRL